jgi:hypothetical protein
LKSQELIFKAASAKHSLLGIEFFGVVVLSPIFLDSQ